MSIYILTSQRRNMILARRIKRNLERLTMGTMGGGEQKLELVDVVCAKCKKQIENGETIVSKPSGRTGSSHRVSYMRHYHFACAKRVNIV